MEFFLFALLMGVDMLLFAALAVRYKYVDQTDDDTQAKHSSSKKQGNINECFSNDDTKL